MARLPLILLSITCVVFFAANSILTRGALAAEQIGAIEFALIRLVAGAVVLCLLVLVQRKSVPLLRLSNVPGVLGLAVYMVGFSVAYIWLDAGVGALILFTGVQLTMFVGALIGGERVPLLRWIGMGVALGGLSILYLPGAEAPDPLGALLMVAAALGFGIYSLKGKKSKTPLQDTAANFLLAAILVLLIPSSLLPSIEATPTGLVLAIISGALTSGLGYAIWYAILPTLGASRGAVVQLAAPVVAVLAGAAILAEPLTFGMLLATAIVIAGVLLALRAT